MAWNAGSNASLPANGAPPPPTPPPSPEERLLPRFRTLSRRLSKVRRPRLLLCYRFVTCVMLVVVLAITTCGCCRLLFSRTGATAERSARAAAISSCATGSHLSKNFGRKSSVNVVRNCLLMEQYKMKLMLELIRAKISIRSPGGKRQKALAYYILKRNGDLWNLLWRYA